MLRSELLEPRNLLAGNASVSGSIWNDLNGNSTRDAGEPAASGITVYLDSNDNALRDTGEPTATTAADGSYSFQNLDAGSYVVREQAPTDFRITSPQASGQRLFVIRGSAGGRILELDIATGVERNSFAVPAETEYSTFGLAFDGQTLWLMSDGNDRLYRLNPNTGAVLGSTALASGFYGSIAALGGKIYLLNRTSIDTVSIFDPATSTITGTLTLQQGVSYGMQDSLGSSPATNELLVGSYYHVSFLRGTNAVQSRTFQIADGFDVTGVEAIGNEIFVGHKTPSEIEIYSRSGTLIRKLDLGSFFSLGEIAGYADLSGSHRLTLTTAQAATDVNFGHQNALGSIRGTRWQDADGDGVRDAGEQPLPDKTVYLDLNDNAARDAGEPTTLTGADGGYTFNNLAAGNYAVREEVTAGYSQTFPANTPDRLFLSTYTPTPSKIHELNPATGAILRSFNAPENGYLDLAFDGQFLYTISQISSKLYKIQADTGAVVASAILPSGTYVGLVFANGKLYSYPIDDHFVVIDPVTMSVTGSLVTSANSETLWDVGQMSNPAQLLGINTFGQLVQFDPVTGAQSIGYTFAGNGSEAALTGSGSKMYASTANGFVRVYSATGAVTQTFNLSRQVTSMVFNPGTGGAQRVALATGQIVTGVDFGTTEPVPSPTEISLSSGNVTVADVSAAGRDNDWRVERLGADIKITDLNGHNIGVTSIPGATGSGTSVVTIPVSVLQPTGQLLLDSRGGTDTVTIDLSGGNPVPAGGINFSGGNPSVAPGDKLVITGGSQGTVTYNYINGHDGSVVMSNFGTVTYTGLEPIVNSGSAANLIFNLPAAASTVFLEDDGTVGNGLSRLRSANATFETTTFANPTGSLTVNRGNAGDSITVGTLPDFTAALTLGTTTNPLSAVTFDGAVTLAANRSLTAYASGTISLPSSASRLTMAGTGGVSLTTSRNISIAADASIVTANGDLTLSANQQTTPTSGAFSGVAINDAVVRSTGTGNITVSGRGGDSGGTLFGVWVTASGILEGGTAGLVRVTGTGGSSSSSVKPGVRVNNAGSRISSLGADILITGLGGTGGSFNRGVDLFSGGQIAAGGAGKVTVTGTGGNAAGDENQGVLVNGSATSIFSNGGDVVITGTGGGSGASQFNGGVVSVSGGSFRAGGSGTLQISGTAGNAAVASNAVAIGGEVTTASGNISITGTPVQSSATAISLTAAIAPGNGGNVILVGDRISLGTGAAVNAPTQSVTLRPKTAGREIDLGVFDTDSALGLSDAELDLVVARTLILGDALAGSLSVSGQVTRAAATDIVLASGGDVNFSTFINTGGGNLLLSPGSTGQVNGSSATSHAVVGPASKVSFTPGSDLAFAVYDGPYDRFNVTGQIDLTGVDLRLIDSIVVDVGESFLIVGNDGSEEVIGTFTGLPEGTVFQVTSHGRNIPFGITYRGGDGNDVVLTAVNKPPESSDQTVETLEDTEYTFQAADFAFSDTDSAYPDAFRAVKIASLPLTGTLKFSGAAIAVGDFVAVGSLDLLTYSPAANANGLANAKFTFQIQDDGGTASGGSDLDPTPNTIAIDITPVNDPPAATSQTIELLEDFAHTFSMTDFGFTDPLDTQPPASFPPNSLASVVLQVPFVPGSFLLAGLNLVPNSTVTIPAAEVATLVFSPALNLNNRNSVPPQFSFRVQDSGGTTDGGQDLSLPATLTLSILSVNDSPVGLHGSTQVPRNLLEDTSFTLSPRDFDFYDANDFPENAFTWLQIVSTPTKGSLQNGGATVLPGSLISVSDIASLNLTFIPAPDGNGVAPDYGSFTFRVQDDGGTAHGGTDTDPIARTISFNVIPVNDEPQCVFGVPPPATDESGLVTSASWALCNPGPENESLQQVLIAIQGNSNPGLFSAVPVFDSTGTLTFTPKPNASGTADITVLVTDDGGTAIGGDDSRTPYTFTIAVTKPYPRHNALKGNDVTADGFIVAADALEIINHINAFRSGSVAAFQAGIPYLDTTRDNFVAPDDVLSVINFINAFGAEREGESSISSPPAETGMSDWLSLLAADLASQPKRKR